ncbi:MAG: hypothetical protein QM778_24655 [Myxococcales bacterium]
MPKRKPKQKPTTKSERAPNVRPLWSGTLSFGLVTVPVDLFPALRSARTPLRMISSEGHALARQYVSQQGDVVESSEIERGVAGARGRFIVLKETELEGLAPEKSQDINVVRFVDQTAISPMFFEHPYLLAPRGAQRAYRLLASTMEELGKVALASFVMRGTEYVLAVRAEQGVLRADVIRFADELREASLVPGVGKAKPSAAKLRSMERALHGVKRKVFAPNEARDVYWEGVEKLAKSKAKKKVDVVTPESPEPSTSGREPLADVIDLMAVLERSLKQGKRQPARKAKRSG